MEIDVDEAEPEFALMLRVPAWCEEGAAVEVNGQPVDVDISPGSYVEIHRARSSGDTVNMGFPMPVRRVECHPYVTENTDHISLMRGPLLYCAEQIDNPGVELRDLVLDSKEPAIRLEPELLGGLTVLQAEARLVAPGNGCEDRLYRTVYPRQEETQTHVTGIMAVPYYAWANREPGAMRIWLRNG